MTFIMAVLKEFCKDLVGVLMRHTKESFLTIGRGGNSISGRRNGCLIY